MKCVHQKFPRVQSWVLGFFDRCTVQNWKIHYLQWLGFSMSLTLLCFCPCSRNMQYKKHMWIFSEILLITVCRKYWQYAKPPAVSVPEVGNHTIWTDCWTVIFIATWCASRIKSFQMLCETISEPLKLAPRILQCNYCCFFVFLAWLFFGRMKFECFFFHTRNQMQVRMIHI